MKYFVSNGRLTFRDINSTNPLNLLIIDAELPIAHRPDDYTYDDGKLTYNPLPPSLADKKRKRALLVSQIRVTTASGKTFDGDEASQGRIARAIIALEYASQSTTMWILANSTVDSNVTIGELKEALMLAGLEQTRIWAMPYE